jgi:tRNA(fMet)-specific endonuclease VapC
MSMLLIDTNIVSFIHKKDSRAIQYDSILEGNQLAVSFVTVGELFEWATIRKWGTKRREQLELRLRSYLVIPVDIELCRVWGAIRAEQQAKGMPISTNDAWIAATARRHSLALVTHNPKHFAGVEGIEVRSVIITK